MEIRIKKTLMEFIRSEFVYHPDRKLLKRRKVLARILQKWEEAGNAIRRIDRRGRLCWKLSPQMRERLDDEEREARFEFEEEDW
jgi:hypothetical protein